MGIQFQKVDFHETYKIEDEDLEKVEKLFHEKQLLSIIVGNEEDSEYLKDYTAVSNNLDKEFRRVYDKYKIPSYKAGYFDFDKKMYIIS
jgi:hypothetical protein